MTNLPFPHDDRTSAYAENTGTSEEVLPGKTGAQTPDESTGTTNPVIQIPPLRGMSSLKRLQDPVKFRKAWTDHPFF